jgi:hypothetical protein
VPSSWCFIRLSVQVVMPCDALYRHDCWMECWMETLRRRFGRVNEADMARSRIVAKLEGGKPECLKNEVREELLRDIVSEVNTPIAL